jgi:hypothetical protein
MALSGAIISFVSPRHTNCGLRLPSTYADKDEGDLCRAQGGPRHGLSRIESANSPSVWD